MACSMVNFILPFAFTLWKTFRKCGLATEKLVRRARIEMLREKLKGTFKTPALSSILLALLLQYL
jgi:hypothetical protein